MAGIRAGDIVVAVNNNPVLGIRDLLDQITLHKPGEQIQVTVYRGTQKLSLDRRSRSARSNGLYVIPAKAGILVRLCVGSRLRL